MSIGENLLDWSAPCRKPRLSGVPYEQGRIGQAASRLVLAGRVQAFDQQRLDTTMRATSGTRNSACGRRSTRPNVAGTPRSASARAALLALYRDALKRGMDDMVPKWAEDQLQTFWCKRSPLPNMVHLGVPRAGLRRRGAILNSSSGVDHEHYIRSHKRIEFPDSFVQLRNAVRPDAHGWRRRSCEVHRHHQQRLCGRRYQVVVVGGRRRDEYERLLPSGETIYVDGGRGKISAKYSSSSTTLL